MPLERLKSMIPFPLQNKYAGYNHFTKCSIRENVHLLAKLGLCLDLSGIPLYTRKISRFGGLAALDIGRRSPELPFRNLRSPMIVALRNIQFSSFSNLSFMCADISPIIHISGFNPTMILVSGHCTWVIGLLLGGMVKGAGMPV